MLRAMEVHLSVEQASQVSELASRTGRDVDEIVQEAVARMLAYDEWFDRQVQTGIDEIERGEFVEEEEMDAIVARMLQR